MKYEVEVIVRYKPLVLDPQSIQIQKTINRVFGLSITDFQAQKRFVYTSQKSTLEDARTEGKELADKLLANFNIEEFEVNIIDTKY